MASSSVISPGGKAVVAARNVDLSGWISDEETRLEFLRWTKFKHIVPHKYMNFDLFEKEGFHFQEWIETQGLSTLVQMKGDWYPDLIRVFYNNMTNIDGVLHSRVKGVNVHIDNDVSFQVAGLKAEGLFSHLRPVQDKMTIEDVFLLYAIKNHVPTHWVEVIKDHMIDAGTKHARHLPDAMFINKIVTLQGADTTKGWCFKDEENMVQSSGSTPALNEDRTNFIPETNFERFVVEKLRRLEQKIHALHQKKNKNDSPTEDSSEESSEEDSMEIF
ncbi:hypothetical protein LR48_Vigan07g145800 [Vigna angularis]|uniref:Uncharacterized protein n=1 Tax=Phaseolus angularis TaxID=3914 RepID=A0A0L9UYW6_PHAAN|nr:hypothetical protein LR48_Vigan07g145800 [Vigna angularis]